ncbi:MAG: ParB/RepB/Spo0J family partition protein [Oscillospiraceae bacterium]|nr:ParB/RepB/Spo0J family partition protein [Oscillospiraceae bacterium]
MAKKGLGRGYSALITDNRPDLPEGDGSLLSLRLSEIEPNRKQARKRFDETALTELASSISAHGLLEPIVVRRKENGYYEIIAGERRWRAARMAGLNELPALLRELSDEEAALLSLIENLQREDLNPVEEAQGYRDLIDTFSLTQEEAASRVGKSRAEVANLLRLLRLPQSILDLVEGGALSYGHARALLPLAEKYAEKDLLAFAKRVEEGGFSVRQTEATVRALLRDAPPVQKPESNPVKAEYYRRLERQVSERAGRKASIKLETNGSGKLLLSFSSAEDLETLIKSLCGNTFFEESSSDENG